MRKILSGLSSHYRKVDHSDDQLELFESVKSVPKNVTVKDENGVRNMTRLENVKLSQLIKMYPDEALQKEPIQKQSLGKHFRHISSLVEDQEVTYGDAIKLLGASGK